MTVSSNAAKAGPFTVNPVLTTQYPFSFTANAADEVRVVCATVETEEQTGLDYVYSETDLVEGSGFEVVLNSGQDSAPGGYVRLLSVPPGTRLCILRSETAEQALELQTGGPWDPASIEAALDKVIRLVQMIRQDTLSRVARPVCEISTDYGYALDLRSLVPPLPLATTESLRFQALDYSYVRYVDTVAADYEYHCYALPGTAKSDRAWKVVRQALDKSSQVLAGTGQFDQPATSLAVVKALTYTLGA